MTVTTDPTAPIGLRMPYAGNIAIDSYYDVTARRAPVVVDLGHSTVRVEVGATVRLRVERVEGPAEDGEGFPAGWFVAEAGGEP